MASLKDLKFELKLIPIIESEEIENIELSKTPFCLQGGFDIIEKSENRRIIAGYANVAIVDNQDQFIPIETLKKGIESLLKDPNYANLMLVHKNIQIGKIIEKFNEYKTHVDDVGLFIVAEIRKDIKTADQIWEGILNGDLNGFSIGCEVIEHHEKCNDEKCITILDKINIFEVSVCSKPVNEKSGFIIVSKSELEDVCEECSEKIDNMSKKDETSEKEEKTEEPKEVEEPTKEEESKEEEKTEEQPKEIEETQEKSVDERIADLERQITAMSEIIQSLTKQEDEEDEEEEIEEEEEEEEMSKKTEEEETPKEEPEVKSEEPKEELDPIQKAFEDIQKSLNSILDQLKKDKEQEDLELAIKARDDQIGALSKKIEILTKSEPDEEEEEKPEPKEEIKEEIKKDLKEKGEPKAIQEKSETTKLEADDEFVIRKGEIYKK